MLLEVSLLKWFRCENLRERREERGGGGEEVRSKGRGGGVLKEFVAFLHARRPVWKPNHTWKH